LKSLKDQYLPPQKQQIMLQGSSQRRIHYKQYICSKLVPVLD